jgi:hypothetical protein
MRDAGSEVLNCALFQRRAAATERRTAQACCRVKRLIPMNCACIIAGRPEGAGLRNWGAGFDVCMRSDTCDCLFNISLQTAAEPRIELEREGCVTAATAGKQVELWV